MLNWRRKRTLQARTEAMAERLSAAQSLVAAIRQAEDAMADLKAANDKFYRSDETAEQINLSALRRERERVFRYYATRDICCEAPHLAALLGIKGSPVGAVPLPEWIQHTNNLDLKEVDAAT